MARVGDRPGVAGAARRNSLLFALGLVLGGTPLHAQPAQTAPGTGFSERFNAGDYAAALPLAQAEVVHQAKTATGSVTHVTAVLNLASTHYKLGDYAAAVERFAEAARLAGDSFGDNSPRNISPLRGLGLSLLAQQRTAEAVPVLARAVALSRRHHGLFNEEQYAMAQPLARAYRQLGLLKDAEREEQYAYRGAESRYGTHDMRLLPALDRLARWYEETARPAQARYLHRRAFTLATDPQKTSAAGAVHALVGVARTYFLEYRDGPEVSDEDSTFPNGTARMISDVQHSGPPSAAGYYLDPQAERALQLAVMIADKAGITSLRQEATMAYGDYLLLDGKAASAEKQYAMAMEFRAARVAAGEVSALEPDPLAKPAPLLLRQPNFTRRHQEESAEDIDIHTTLIAATVTPQGKLEQVKLVSSDENPTRQRMLLSAAERAVYRPAYVAGKAVATEGVEVVFTSRNLKSERLPARQEGAPKVTEVAPEVTPGAVEETAPTPAPPDPLPAVPTASPPTPGQDPPSVPPAA